MITKLLQVKGEKVVQKRHYNEKRKPKEWKQIVQNARNDTSSDKSNTFLLYPKVFPSSSSPRDNLWKLKRFERDLNKEEKKNEFYSQRGAVYGKEIDTKLRDEIIRKIKNKEPVNFGILKLELTKLLGADLYHTLCVDGGHKFGKPWAVRFCKRHSLNPLIAGPECYFAGVENISFGKSESVWPSAIHPEKTNASMCLDVCQNERENDSVHDATDNDIDSFCSEACPQENLKYNTRNSCKKKLSQKALNSMSSGSDLWSASNLLASLKVVLDSK